MSSVGKARPRRWGRAGAVALAWSVTCAPMTARADDVTPVSEATVLRDWLARSREVASLRAQVRGARFDVVTATLWPNPGVQVNFMGTPWGTPPDGALNLGVQVSQALPVFGQVDGRRGAALAALSLAEVNVAASLWSMASDLDAAMVERAFSDAQVELVAQSLAEVSRLADVVQRRVAAGAASSFDALRAQVTASTLRAALDDATLERDRDEARLAAMIADPAVTRVPITRAGLTASRGPDDLAGLAALALRRRPDLEAARRGELAALATSRRWGRENRVTPSVWIGAYGTQNADSVSVLGGVSFNLPVFDRNQGNIGRAESDAEGQRALAEALEARVAREVAGAWQVRNDAREALARFRAQGLAPAAELVARAEVTYRSGGVGSSFTIQDLFDAYRTLWDARAQELALARTLAETESDLARATATVTP